jgi:transcriptional regulator with XRE-family HTH domain
MTLLRRVLGETLRGRRLRQRRTLREVSSAARVSLGYLSEVERGQKEASSELLASICEALDVKLSDLLREVSETMRRSERAAEVARMPGRVILPAPAARRPVPAGVGARPEVEEIDLDAEFGPEFTEFEADGSDDDPFAGSADGAVTDSVAEPEEELDGVDLAELEAGGELGDLGEVLFRTELAGPSDGPYGARCLAAVA